MYDQQTHDGFLKTLILRTSHNHRDGTPDEIFIEFKTGVPTDEEWTRKLQQLSTLLSEEWDAARKEEEEETTRAFERGTSNIARYEHRRARARLDLLH